ncbi:MAG: hypothetical protein ACLUOI_32565 [Eisenbergiella sp.]
MKGLLEGAPLNYDGKTDITSERTTTFERSVVVWGRSKAWTEDDFSMTLLAARILWMCGSTGIRLVGRCVSGCAWRC